MNHIEIEKKRFAAVSVVAGVISFAMILVVNSVYPSSISFIVGLITFGAILPLIAGGMSNIKNMTALIIFAPLCVIGVGFAFDAGSYPVGAASLFALSASFILAYTSSKSRTDASLAIVGILSIAIGEISLLLLSV